MLATLLAAVGWVLLSIVALAVSVAVHVTSSVAREAVRTTVTTLASDEIRGRLTIGHIATMRAGRIVIHDVSVFDAHDRRVLYAERIEAVPDLWALAGGVVRIKRAEAFGGKLRLINDEEGLPTFISEAFAPSDPTPGSGPTVHVVVEDLRVADLEAYGEVDELDRLRIRVRDIRGRLDAEEAFQMWFWSATGELTEPYPFVARIDAIDAHISTAPMVGTTVHARIHAPHEARAGNPPIAARADDRVRVALTFKSRDDTSPAELDLIAHLDPLDVRTLEEVGVEQAALLMGQTRGYARITGPPEALTVRASLDTAGGPITARVLLDPAQIDASVHTWGVDLERIVNGAPPLHIGGDARIVMATDDPASNPALSVELDPFVYEDIAIPTLRAEGVLMPEGLRIDSIDAPHAGGDVHGSGMVTFTPVSASLEVQAHLPQIAADPNVHRMAPDARGALDAELRVAFDPERYDVEGRVSLARARYGPLTAASLRADGSVTGSPTGLPSVAARVRGNEVAVSGYHLGAADLRVRGGGGRYSATGTFLENHPEHGDRAIGFDATLQMIGERFAIALPRLDLRAGPSEWHGSVAQLLVTPDVSIAIDQMVLASESQRLEAHGLYSFVGDNDLEAQLQDFELRHLPAFIPGMPELGGRVDMHLQVQGKMRSPEIIVEGALRQGEFEDLHDIDAVYAIQYADNRLAVDASMQLGSGEIAVTGSGELDSRARDPMQALENGVYEVDMTAANMSLSLVRSLVGPDMPNVQGVFAGRVLASGPLLAPTLEGNVMVPRLEMPGWSPLSMVTTFDYENGSLLGRAVIGDHGGDLLEVEGSAVIDVVNAVLNPDQVVASLESLPWRMSIKLPQRTLATWPEPLRDSVPAFLAPSTLSASGTLTGGAFETRADIDGFFEYRGDDDTPACSTAGNPRLSFRTTTRDDVTTVTADGFLGAGSVMRAEASAPTPLGEWLRGAIVPTAPPVQLTVHLDDAPTELMPDLCEVSAGALDADIEIENLFTDVPSIRAALRAARLRFIGSPAMAIEASMLAQGDTLTADARLASTGGGEATLEATLPILFGATDPAPRIDPARRLQGEVVLESTSIAPFLTWVPMVDDIAGIAVGYARVDGTLENLDVEGEIRLRDGFAEIVALGQQLEQIEGVITLHGHRLELRDIVAHDSGGSATIDGVIELDGLMPSTARLSLAARGFPVRNEGAILANINGGASVEATITPERLDMQTTVRELNVQLPEQTTRTLQPLDEHPDIIVIEDPEHGAPAVSGSTPEDPYVVHVGVNARQRPFWVRRSDFAAQMVASLDATYADPDLRVNGYVELRRGFFEVLGKRFELERGSLNFDGGTQMDPEVDIVATHVLRGTSNTVSVHVSGRLSALAISFTSTFSGDQGEIIAALLGNRRGASQSESQQDATEQAASFVTGVLAGVGTLFIREQFGDVVPVIAIETEGNSVRARVGFQVDRFVPEFLRGVVQGAYVEGQVLTQQGSDNGDTSASSGTSQASGLGTSYLLELQFPYSIVGTGTFAPPTNWSVDVTYEP